MSKKKNKQSGGIEPDNTNAIDKDANKLNSDKNGSNNQQMNNNVKSIGTGIGTGTQAPEEKGTIAEIFTLIYNITAVAGALAATVFIIIGIINFLLIFVLKSKEKKLSKGGQLIIGETLEYKFLNYTSEKLEPNAKKKNLLKRLFPFFDKKKGISEVIKDPLLIKLQIQTTNILFYIVVVFLFVIIANILVSFALAVRLTRSGHTDVNFFKQMKPKLDILPLFVIVACLYIAIVSILLIKIIFKGALEKVIYDFNKKAYLLKRNIGVNLYVDKTFIDMLYNDNFDSIKDQIKNKINGNMQAASKMIFTYNVYKHYTTNFTLSSPYMQDFKNAFTFENLKGIQQSGKFEPVEFLKYSDSIESVTFDDHFMMDMTSDVESTEDALSSDLLNAYTRNKINGIILRDDVSNKLNSVSNVAQNFTKTNLEKIYKIIFKFVLSMFIFACINLAIIVGCFFIYKTMSKIQSGKQLVSNNL